MVGQMNGLAVDDLTVHFGGVYALREMSIEIPRGTCVGLAGPNGSGKSTMVNAITGLVDATGEVTIDGSHLALGRPGAAAKLGLRRSYQTPRVHPQLTALENVCTGDPSMLGRRPQDAIISRKKSADLERRRRGAALAALNRVGGGHAAYTRGAALTYGHRRLVELARVLMASPTVLLLDEPGAGLNDAEIEALCSLITELTGDGVAVLLIEHKIALLNRVCHRLIILEEGIKIDEGLPAQVWSSARVRSAYIGEIASAGT
jgi:branched-chain amino acid transport system ATP-binding protein